MVRRICLFSEDMASFFRGITPKYIILTGCLFTLLFAFFSNEVYHPDEHFQILEYAHMKLFGTPVPAELPWEYVLMMRPGLQPMIAYGLGWLLDAGGIYSPYLLFSLLHVLSGALSIVSVLAFYRAVRGTLSGPSEEKWLLLLSFFLWFMVYLHVRFSSETFSGNLLLLLVSVYLSYGQRERKRPFVWGAGMGLLAGAAFISRYQVGFALFGFGLWLLVFARRWRLLAGLALGGAAMLGVGVLVDYWLYGTWTCSPVNYVRENILNSHIDKFGIKPWYFYLSDTVSKGFVVYGLAILAATCWFFVRNPKHVITWTMVPFLLAHQLVGHKELRFLFPVLPFIPFFAVLLARDLPQRLLRNRIVRLVGVLAVVLNFALIVYNVIPIKNTDIFFYRMMDDYCRGKERVCVLNVKDEPTYYSYGEFMIGPRVVTARFYMPRNMELRLAGSISELEREARRLRRACPDVFILSGDERLPEHTALPVKKVAWNPYPKWIIRYFNFNDWVSLSIRRKNLYKVGASAGGK